MTIKRVAQALADHTGSYDFRQFDADAYSLSHARAALDAVSEPTPEMIEVGALAFGGVATEWNRDAVVLIWRAMHTAMMKEISHEAEKHR